LEFSNEFNHHLLDQEKFQVLEEFLSFTGPHIKKLIISRVKVDPKIFQKLLDLLPNLESIELEYVGVNKGEQTIKWDLKSTKIERITIVSSSAGIAGLLESLHKCAIKETDLRYSSLTESEVVRKFLKSQEKTLRKLTIHSDFDMPDVVKDLRLDYLQILSNQKTNVSFDFLQHQVALRFLRLDYCTISSEACSMICELKDLEILEMLGRVSDGSGLNNLHKLVKLKRLQVGRDATQNILHHLKFGVFSDLEELGAYFRDASLESVQEMKQITPKLRKLVISSASSDTINALLGTLGNLEDVRINFQTWEIPSGKVYPKVTYLRVDSNFDQNFSADQLARIFPNLEYLQIYSFRFKVTESFFVELLCGLKRLKTLRLNIWTHTRLEVYVNPCFREYGNHLEVVDVSVCETMSGDVEKVTGFTVKKEPNEHFRFDDIFNEVSWD
jgi:hypothetical protein